MGVLVSLDIGTRNVTAVEGIAGKNLTVEVSAVANAALMDDTVIDGMLRQPTEVMTKINMMLPAAGIKTKNAVVTINGGNMLVREFDIPQGKPRQMEAIVRNEMISTYAAGESDVIEGKLLGAFEKDGAKMYHVRAMAVNRDLVTGYYNLIMNAKLKPVAMDSHANAVEKLLSGKPKLNGTDLTDKCGMLLDFGQSGIMCYITNGYQICTTRFIPLGMSDLASMLVGQMMLSIDQEKTNFAPLIDFTDEIKKDEPIMLTAANFVTQCCNEIQRVIMYAMPKLPFSSVNHAFVYGGGSQMPGVSEYIGKLLGIDAKALTSVSTLKFKNAADEKQLALCLNAAGALIRL